MEMAAAVVQTKAQLIETSARLEEANTALKTLQGRKEVKVGDKLRRIIGKAYFGKKKS